MISFCRLEEIMDKRLYKIGLIVSLVLFLAACGEEAVKQPAPAVSKSVTRATSVTAVPPVTEEEKDVKEYVYNPLGKRDPFENPLRAIAEVATETGIPLTPLQKYDLGQLRLIGVIVGKGNPRAMVIAPDGKSFILQTGTKLGKNNGSVVDITTEAVLVKEKYLDFAGEVKTSIQEIKLPKSGGVK
jgi:type IV pilus assembly protein PilP